jgi:hypothetical protein
MKGLRYVVCGVALVASVGPPSASASNWDPVNTTLHGSQVGTMTLRTHPSLSLVGCNSGTTDVRVASATPSVASTINTSNPIVFSSCTLLGFPGTVTTFGTWNFTGVSTTNVSLTAVPTAAGGTVATIGVPAIGCTLTIGETTIANNTWNNTTKTLTTNVASGFPITPNNESCGTLLGTSGTLTATFNIPGANLT